MLLSQTRSPSQIIGELLAGHPEAASLQGEATHCRALARTAAANVARTFAAAQAARLAYEELRHRLDPRYLRTVDFGAGLLILALLGAGLTLLDVIELSDSLGGIAPALPALAAAAVWLTGAWVAALASREHRWPVVAATVSVAVLLGLLLAVLHGFGRHTLVAGVLVGVFILVLAAGAAVLVGRMECASLFVARRRWRRARRAHEAAARTERDDAEVAATTTEAWLGMVRVWANSLGEDERLVRETVTLAIVLLEDSRPQLQSLAALSGLSGDAAPQDRRGGGLLRRVRAPVAYPDHAGIHQPDAVKQARHQVVRARDVMVRCREMGVKALLERGHVIGQQVGARVGDDQVAAPGHGSGQRGDYPSRIGQVRDVVQDREQHDGDRLGEVQGLRRLLEYRVRVLYVGVQVGRDTFRPASQQRAGVGKDQRVVVHVDDLALRRDGL